MFQSIERKRRFKSHKLLDSGFSSIDLLVGLGLAALVSLLALPMLKSTLQLERKVHRSEQQTLTERRIRDAMMAEDPNVIRELPTIEVLDSASLHSLPGIPRSVSTSSTSNGIVIRMMIPIRTAIFRAVYQSETFAPRSVISQSSPPFSFVTPSSYRSPTFLSISKNSQQVLRWMRITAQGSYICDGSLQEPSECTPRSPGRDVGAVGLADDVLFFVDSKQIFRRVSLVTGSSQPIANEISGMTVSRTIPIESGAVVVLHIATKERAFTVPLVRKVHSLKTIEVFS